jgi:ppGpp synthetase/RelA/SpoT-type nucleotidyltranferase
MVASADDEYYMATAPLKAFQIPLKRLIETLLEDSGIQVHGVSSRMKSRDSVLQKIARSSESRSVDSLTDLLGIRVVTYFPDEVDSVARLVEREFAVDKGHSVDKRKLLDPDRFGYLSLHYILALGDERLKLAEYRHYRGLRFELQIRSILQHAWAEIEHDLGYKSKAAVPPSARRRFSRLAGLLELADAEFLGIREQLAQSDSPPVSPAEEADIRVARLLSRPQPVELPNWPQGMNEGEYISYVAAMDRKFVALDRRLLSIPPGSGRFEACDLLGPTNELIHIKRARSSASFAHLFNQALVSAEILLRFADARNELARIVSDSGDGRELPSDFLPRVVVLALPTREGKSVSLEQIPAHARITLARVAQTLESLGVALGIVGIEE